MAFWLESGCLKDFPSFRYIWDAICSLCADITESHHFESESFDFDVPISPSGFQWGVERVRLFQPSWQADTSRGHWSLPLSVEKPLRKIHELLLARRSLFGSYYGSISKSVFIRDLTKLTSSRLIICSVKGFSISKTSAPEHWRQSSWHWASPRRNCLKLLP